MKILEQYKRFIFIGIILIALGVAFGNLGNESNSSLGTVFIAVGGLFFIVGMKKKREGVKDE